MDDESSQPGSPVGRPLQAINANAQQRDSLSTVHDKISQFNSMSIAMQSKQLERKTADAALKRAMIGREEAEVELRKCKEELKALRKAVDEGKERERRVGERLETVMENYGRAKETHAHTQALWEKEIRRARKETFKTQSTHVKLQEELKTARSATKTLEETVEREKKRSHMREQDAFEARYQMVGVQEKLEQALALIKVVEQERDAYKTAAKNEEVARIAAEGRIPLPVSHDPLDEFASPAKKTQMKKRKLSVEPRYSLSTWEVEATSAAELEIEDLTSQIQWERQRADRAQEMIDFLRAECEMKFCACGRARAQISRDSSAYQLLKASERHSEPAEEAMSEDTEEQLSDHPDEAPSEHMLEAEDDATERPLQIMQQEFSSDNIPMPPLTPSPSRPAALQPSPELAPVTSKKGPRLSTVFCPSEGVFRTVSEQDASLLEAQEEAQVIVQDADPQKADPSPYEHEEEETEELPTPVEPETELDYTSSARLYARTPSVEPPSFAMLGQQRTSLLSLLNAPHGGARGQTMPHVPMVEDPAEAAECQDEEQPDEGVREPDFEPPPRASLETRPHTSTALYGTVTTTVPLRNEDEQRESSVSFNEKLRTPSSGSTASFDTTNPALTPTMSREQALAKIRERRGRARSAQNGSAPASRNASQGKDKRDLSAPTNKVASKSR
ncbi:uncharacterized protein J7T54_004832 [Emericellopsis cladophorae]|uniref:Uncharacterized protein n=1 Tax=Emericellopsis cladophorae TaxID=2686198 RepID=A0A9P9Y6A5_9HYPO|nr:uncharacterized protein J7T54_004832 [Emericellopsis cladophorae]KAI6784286.1 hypothetical protein J7T54_004832 [Emericellopsis cladophorae]